MKHKKQWTIEDVKKEVRRLDPQAKYEDSDSSFKTAVLLMAAAVVGTKMPELKRFTGYDMDFVRDRVCNLRRGGVFTPQHKLAIEWFDKKHGVIAFWADCCVAEGFLART